MLRRYASRFRFTWASTRWLVFAAWALFEAEKRKNSVSPKNTMPVTATAVNESERII